METTTIERKRALNERIEAHGWALCEIFGIYTSDPIGMCKKLRRLEVSANALALRGCNEPDGLVTDEEERTILDAVDKILCFRAAGVPVFFNKDPRGYALKIDDAFMREHAAKPHLELATPPLHRDWGGYGIIAPDLR